MPTVPDRRPYDAREGADASTRDLSRPLPVGVSWWTLAAFVVVFAVAFVTLGLPWWIPVLYLTMSVIAFAAYAIDKSAARRGTPRISEQALLTIGLLCGWPGAVIAQQVFRHKTRKRTFRRAFWRTVALNIVLLGAFLTVATVRGWDLDPSWLAVTSDAGTTGWRVRRRDT